MFQTLLLVLMVQPQTQPTTVLTVAPPLAVVTLHQLVQTALTRLVVLLLLGKLVHAIYDSTKGTVYDTGEWDDLVFDGTFWLVLASLGLLRCGIVTLMIKTARSSNLDYWKWW